MSTRRKALCVILGFLLAVSGCGEHFTDQGMNVSKDKSHRGIAHNPMRNILKRSHFLKGVKYDKHSGWGATLGYLYNLNNTGHECLTETAEGVLFEFEGSERNMRFNVGYGHVMWWGDSGMLGAIPIAFSVKGSYLHQHEETGDFDRSSYNGLMLDLTVWNMGVYVGIYEENTMIGASFRI